MFVWNLLLAIAWAILIGSFSLPNLIVGFLLSYSILWLLASRGIITYSNYIDRFKKSIEFIWFFLVELTVANFRMAIDVLRPHYHISPGIIAVPLDAKTDGEITLLANLVTLTPGSLSLDISADRKILFVHTMYAGDVEYVRKSIKEGFETRVVELLQ